MLFPFSGLEANPRRHHVRRVSNGERAEVGHAAAELRVQQLREMRGEDAA